MRFSAADADLIFAKVFKGAKVGRFFHPNLPFDRGNRTFQWFFCQISESPQKSFGQVCPRGNRRINMQQFEEVECGG